MLGLPRTALTLEARRRLRFVFHAAGWLHSTGAVVSECETPKPRSVSCHLESNMAPSL